MKNLLSPFFLVSVCALTILSLTNCKDDTAPSTVDFLFNYTVKGESLNLGQVYEINGTAVSFDFANLYIGDMTFIPEAGDNVDLGSQYLLVTPILKDHEVTTLTAGSYQKIQFAVGVNDTENDQTETDFTSRSTDDPLGMQSPSMHWGWAGGYKYIRIDGMVDTDNDGIPETPLAYHLGNFDTFDFIAEVEIDLNYDVKEGNNTLAFEFDLSKLFTNIDISTQTDTHVFNDQELAKAFHANLINAFSF